MGPKSNAIRDNVSSDDKIMRVNRFDRTRACSSYAHLSIFTHLSGNPTSYTKSTTTCEHISPTTLRRLFREIHTLYKKRTWKIRALAPSNDTSQSRFFRWVSMIPSSTRARASSRSGCSSSVRRARACAVAEAKPGQAAKPAGEPPSRAAEHATTQRSETSTLSIASKGTYARLYYLQHWVLWCTRIKVNTEGQKGDMKFWNRSLFERVSPVESL